MDTQNLLLLLQHCLNFAFMFRRKLTFIIIFEITYRIGSNSVGSILNLKCGAGKNNSYFKIDVDELPLGKVEFLCIQSKIEPITDVVDLCPRHKLQFIGNFSNGHRCKCADPFSVHKAFVKTVYIKYR